jgi:site-specific DNA-cytosine methylase
VDNTKQLGISFCSGYGGLERGLELAGVKTRIVAHVEIEAYAVANLVAKMEQGLLVPSPVWTNLKAFPMEAFRGRVDFITAGYPCQPFSCAGQRKGTDDQRHLWPYIRRIYQTICPRWMFFENVEGHVTLGLSTVISDLEEDGYRVETGLFTAAEVGAPHRRKRVFILANSRLIGRRGRCESRGEVRECGVSEDKVTGSGASSEGVADSLCLDAQRKRSDNDTQGRQEPDGQIGLCHGTRWPARPGQPQYDWEEPRVA